MGWAFLFKTVKGVATFIEVVDTTADVAVLGDEIARAAMGDDYDPAFRDKAQAVGEAGKKVDALVAQVKFKQTDIDNLEAVIKEMDLSLDLHDFKQFQAQALIDKVGQFNLSFGSVPTAYTWLIGPAARTDSNITTEELLKNIADVQAYLDRLAFNPANTAILSSALTIKALVLAYKIRVKRQQKRAEGAILDEIELRPKGRQRRNAFSGMDMLPAADQKAIKALRKKFRLAPAVDVFVKVGSAVSLGFTIKNIFDRVDSRNDAFDALEKQLAEYKQAEAAYRYCLDGYTSAPTAAGITDAITQINQARQQAADMDASTADPTVLADTLTKAEVALSKELNKNGDFLSAKTFFQVDDPNNLAQKLSWSVEDDLGLAFGMAGLIAGYNDRGDRILGSIRALFEDMMTSLQGAKSTGDPTDEAVKPYVIGSEMLQELAVDKTRFEDLAAIASDKLRKTQERKDDGFDLIQLRFQDSLQLLMSKVINDASEKLRDVQFASQLLVSAQRILRKATTEQASVDKRTKDAQIQNAGLRKTIQGFLQQLERPSTDADVTQYIQDNGLGGPVEIFERDRYIQTQAQAYAQEEWVASNLDTDPTKRFPTQESALVCLTLMLKDLQNTLSSPELPSLPSFHLRDRYEWLPNAYALPLAFSCRVTCNSAQDEFIPCFAKTQTSWNGLNRESLSWYLSSKRHDFTFRTNLFGKFPAIVRLTSGFTAVPGQTYRMRCEIKRDTATYWIDDNAYATATYSAEDVPASGYIGFAVFGTADINVEDISVQPL